MSITANFKGIYRISTLLLLLFSLVSPAWAAETIGTTVAVSGQVDLLRGGTLPATALKKGDAVAVGDFVRTKSNSSAEILFKDGNLIKIGPRSRIDINEYAAEQDTRTLSLSRGKVEAIVAPPTQHETRERPKRFEIHTPNAVAGVRGTDFLVFFDSNTTGVLVKKVHEGDSVYAFNLLHPGEVVIIPAEHLTLIRNQSLPTPPRPAGEGEVRAFGHLIQQLWDGGSLIAATGQDEHLTLQPLPISENYPQLLAVEVGVVDMVGSAIVQSAYDMQVSMTSNFFAPTSDAAPTYWGASNVQGTWSPVSTPPSFNPVDTMVYLSGSGANGQASAEFSINNWNTATGQWNASIDFGYGTTSVGVPFQFSGTAGGIGASGNTSGTFSGTAIGTASPSSENPVGAQLR